MFQGDVVSLRRQISNFEAVTLPDLRAHLRGAAATGTDHRIKGNQQQDPFQRCYLSKCLFIIGTGGNDYLLNYFNPRRNGSDGAPPLPEFTRSLITKLSGHLQVHRLSLACLLVALVAWLKREDLDHGMCSCSMS
jgi:hypothetical protein